MAASNGPNGLLTLICITCGHQQHFETKPPLTVRCGRCQGRVFRNFFTPVDADEATLAQLEETASSAGFDDDAPVTADELRDLDDANERGPNHPA